MPLNINNLENKVLGPAFIREYKRGEITILRRVIEKRFGALPDWAEERLAGRSPSELEDLSVRVLNAQNIEDLLQ